MKFIHFYNSCRKHATTEEMPKHVIDNYNDKSLIENVAIANENSRKWHIEREMSEYNEGDVALLINWISKINITKIYLKRGSKERN